MGIYYVDCSNINNPLRCRPHNSSPIQLHHYTSSTRRVRRRHKCVPSGPAPSAHVHLSQTWSGWQWELLTMGWEFFPLCTDFTHTVIWQLIHSCCYPQSGSGLGAFRFLVSSSKNWIKGWCLPVTVWLRSQACEEMIHQSLASTFSPVSSVPCPQSCPECHVFFQWSVGVLYFVFFSLLLSWILGSNTHTILFYLFHKSRIFLWIWNHVLNFYMFHN